MEILLNVEQLAAVLHKSPASIRSDASRNPNSLPPICRLPGNKRLLWQKIDVEAWTARFVAPPPISAVTNSSSCKRGRPRKAEQLRKLREQGGHHE